MLPRNFTTCRFGILDFVLNWPNHRENHFAIEDHHHVAVAALEVALVVAAEVAHAVAGVAALVAVVTVVDRERDQDHDDDAAEVRVAARKEEKKVDRGQDQLNGRDTHVQEAEDDRAPRINQRIHKKKHLLGQYVTCFFLHFPPFCLFTPI